MMLLRLNDRQVTKERSTGFGRRHGQIAREEREKEKEEKGREPSGR